MGSGFEPARLSRSAFGGEWVDVVRVGSRRTARDGAGPGGELEATLAAGATISHGTSRLSFPACGAIAHPWIELDGEPGRALGPERVRPGPGDLIDQLGLSAPAVLGVSFGGAIALEFAAEHPRVAWAPRS